MSYLQQALEQTSQMGQHAGRGLLRQQQQQAHWAGSIARQPGQQQRRVRQLRGYAEGCGTLCAQLSSPSCWL